MKTSKKSLTLFLTSLAAVTVLATTSVSQTDCVLAESTTSQVTQKTDVSADLAWIDQTSSLTATEKTQLKAAYQKAAPIYDKIAELYDKDGNLTDEKQAAQYDKELDSIFKSVEHLNAKIDAENDITEKKNVTNRITQSTALTTTEKEAYLALNEQIQKLEKEVEELRQAGNPDSQKIKTLEEQLAPLYSQQTDFDQKMVEGCINASSAISQEEKESFITTYKKIDAMKAELANLSQDKGAQPSDEETKALEDKIDKAQESIRPLEEKVFGTYNDVQGVPYHAG